MKRKMQFVNKIGKAASAALAVCGHLRSGKIPCL